MKGLRFEATPEPKKQGVEMAISSLGVFSGAVILAASTLAVLDYLVFRYQAPIATARQTSVQLTPIAPAPNTLYAESGQFKIEGRSVAMAVGLGLANVEQLKTELQRGASGNPMWALFRTALLASSPVERFLLLYHILLAMRPDANGEDSQREVDDFIRQEEPSVAVTPHPRFGARMETIYSRLRNEIAHRRQGVNLARADTHRHRDECRTGG